MELGRIQSDTKLTEIRFTGSVASVQLTLSNGMESPVLRKVTDSESAADNYDDADQEVVNFDSKNRVASIALLTDRFDSFSKKICFYDDTN